MRIKMIFIIVEGSTAITVVKFQYTSVSRLLQNPSAVEACQYLTGIVGKDPLLLRELNLSERELGDTRVNQIAALLQDKHCKLNTLM